MKPFLSKYSVNPSVFFKFWLKKLTLSLSFQRRLESTFTVRSLDSSFRWNDIRVDRIFTFLKYISLIIFGCGFTAALWAPTLAQAANSGQHFQRVLIIVLENQNYEDAILDPYLNSLARKGANLTHFHGLSHPSYANYLAMISGKMIPTIDDLQRDLNDRTIADLLKSAGLTWKNYAEDYPGGCFTDPRHGFYVRKHVPFMSFIEIQNHECGNVVSANQFSKDLQANTLPNYMFYSPNIKNDGHDTGLAYGSNWLKNFLEPLLNDNQFMQGTLIIITFDESRQDTNNHIYTVLLGRMIKPGEYTENYTQFNVLRTIETNFGLDTLAEGDGNAEPITGIWK